MTEIKDMFTVMAGFVVVVLFIVIMALASGASSDREETPTDLQCLSIVIANYPELIKTP